MMKVSYGYMGWCPSREVINQPSLVAIGTVAMEMFLVCHVILQDHMIKRSCDFMDSSQLR